MTRAGVRPPYPLSIRSLGSKLFVDGLFVVGIAAPPAQMSPVTSLLPLWNSGASNHVAASSNRVASSKRVASNHVA